MEHVLTDHAPSRFVKSTGGREYLWFSGTDYLGMAGNDAFLKGLGEGLRLHGAHFGSSRNNSLQIRVYEEAEQLLAGFAGAPAALCVSSGMWAGQLVRNYIPGVIGVLSPGATVMHHEAPGLHPALSREEAPAGAPERWSDWLQETVAAVNACKAGHFHLIYTDTVGVPWTEAYDFSPLKQLENTNALLVADDSHGLGVLGDEGRGSYTALSGLGTVEVVVVASLNKAMGIPGGVVLGEASLLARLRRSRGFSGGSPTPPAYMHAFKKLLTEEHYQAAHQVLRQRNAWFRSQFEIKRFPAVADGFPVYCTGDQALYPFLENNGILVSCFPYPGPQDPRVLRLVISAAHLQEDLDTLVTVLNRYYGC